MLVNNKRKSLQTGFSQADLCKANQLRHIALETHWGVLKGWLAFPNQNGVPEPTWMKINYVLKEIKPNLLVLVSFDVIYEDSDVTTMILPFNPWQTIEARCIANFEDARFLLSNNQ